MRFAIALCAVLVVGVCGVRPIHAQDISHTVVTQEKDLVFTTTKGYTQVRLTGTGTGENGAPGEPLMPYRDLLLLLPAGGQAANITAEIVDTSDLAGQHTIEPAGTPDPTTGMPLPTNPDATVYASRSGIRPQAAALLGTEVLRGYRLARVRVFPLDYVPAEGRLTLRRSIRITVQLDSDPSRLSTLAATIPQYDRPAPIFDALIQSLVANPSKDTKTTLGYRGSSTLPEPATTAVEYLLICPFSMFDEFQPLLDWKTRKGIPAEAVDIDWVLAHYPGETPQRQIKECIKDYAENRGTIYVALGGDDTLIPVQYCTQGDYYVPTPCDLYYAGLDDMDWDDRPDGDVGRTEYQDTVDFAPDVFLGRLPIRTEADVTAIVNKTIAYEKNSPATGFAEKMLMAGNQVSQAGDAESKCEAFYSTYIDPYWAPARYRLYDTATDFAGGATYAANAQHLADQLNDGYNFLYECSHGGTTGWCLEGDTFTTDHAAALAHADRYVNVVTFACLTNAFHDAGDPCLSEALLRNPNGGAVTYIGASVVNWSNSTYFGAFYRNLFTGVPTGFSQKAGAAFAAAKYQVLDLYAHYAMNFVGDPELPLYIANPRPISPTFPSACLTGAQDFVVETGIPGSTVCIYKPGEVYIQGVADGNGRYTATIEPATLGTGWVTITAANRYPFEGTLSIQASRAGKVAILERACRAGDTLHLTLVDIDLAGTGTHSVRVTTSAGDSELLAMTESPTQTGCFAAVITVQAGAIHTGSGIIEIQSDETILAHYDDADDGSGNSTVHEDSATVDQTPPAIGNVQVSDITSHSARISLTTNVPATIEISCGLDCGAGSSTFSASSNLKTEHSIELTNLDAGATWFFAVRATDERGNTATDDNSGQCYSFTTRAPLRVPSQYATLQAALTAATAGDTVLIAPGRYAGAGTAINKPITIRSEAGPARTIIDGQNTSVGLNIASTQVAVRGLTFINCSPGITAGSSRLDLANCRFYRNERAVKTINMAMVRIAGCTFLHNWGSTSAGAISMLGQSASSVTQFSVENSVFAGNKALDGNGGAICFGTLYVPDAQITHCTFFHNTASSGVGSSLWSSGGDARVTITNSILWDAGAEVAGSYVRYVNSNLRTGSNGEDGNISVNPGFLGDDDYHLAADSPCIDAGTSTETADDLEGNPRPADGNADGQAIHDMGAFEYMPDRAVLSIPWFIEINARQGGPQAITPLTIRNAGTGDLSWEASCPATWLGIATDRGTCPGGATQPIQLIVDPAAMATGSYLTWVTILAEGSSASQSVPVFVQVGRTLDVPGTYATIQAALNGASDGDTILLAPGTYTGTGNVNLNLGGRHIIIDGQRSAIIDCQNAGRAFSISGAARRQAVLRGLTIRNGYADGGSAVSIYRASPRIQDCVFGNCTATGAYGGAVYSQLSEPLLVNCLFRNNTGSYAGGVCLDNNSYGRVVNCTFTGNSSSMGAGAIGSNGGQHDIANCILWGDSGLWPELVVGSCLSIHHCDLQGGREAVEDYGQVDWGPGNIQSDPLFVDAQGGNLQLGDSSPCIDAGDTAALPGDMLADLNGQPRLAARTCSSASANPLPVDMGAYEYHDWTTPSGLTGDFTHDCVVDALDVASFLTCMTGADRPVAAGCSTRDIDGDGDVDQSDFGILQKCLSDAGIPADASCNP